MKRIVALAISVAMLAGCAANGNQRGYYDEDGQYHPSQSAVNADNTNTALGVAAAVGIAGALATGITAIHKANKNKHKDDDNSDNDNRRWEHERQQQYRYNQSRQHHRGHYGDINHPVHYNQGAW